MDHSFFMQPTEDVPFKAFPRPASIVQRQEQQRQSDIINSISVVVHHGMFCRDTEQCNMFSNVRNQEEPPAGGFAVAEHSAISRHRA